MIREAKGERRRNLENVIVVDEGGWLVEKWCNKRSLWNQAIFLRLSPL
jgi:hypothetical protein